MVVTTVTVMVLLAVGQGASSAWREGRPRMVVNYMAGEQGELDGHGDDALSLIE